MTAKPNQAQPSRIRCRLGTAMINTYYRVRRWTRKDFSAYQKLQRVTRVLGIEVWSTTVDREEVPSWAVIQRATLGSTEWKSRLFKQYADILENQ